MSTKIITIGVLAVLLGVCTPGMAAVLAQYTWQDNATSGGDPVADVSLNGHDGVVYYGATAVGGVLDLRNPDGGVNYKGTAWINPDENILDGRDFVYMKFENVVLDAAGFQGSTIASEWGHVGNSSWALNMVSSGTTLAFDVIDSNGYIGPYGIVLGAGTYTVEAYYDGTGGAGGVAQTGLRIDGGSWVTGDGAAAGVFGTSTNPLAIGAMGESSGVGTGNNSGWHGTIGTATFADVIPEPATVSLLLIGSVATLLRRNKR